MSDNIQYQMPLIGDKAPEFVAHTTNGTVNFPADYSGKWVILFSHPADFTPVCTTEFMTFQAMLPDLNKLFEIVVSDIPHEIYAKAKSYSVMSEYSLSASFTEQVATTLTNLIPTKRGAIFRFRENEVKSNQKQININFQDAENFANDAKSEAQSLEDVWKSISGDTNIQELKSAFDKVIKIIQKLTKTLDSYVSASTLKVNAGETVQGAMEAAPKVAANALDAVEDAAQSAINKIEADANQTWKNLTGKN